MTRVEVDLVGTELSRCPADQLDELVLISGDRRPAHPLTADEGDEDLGRPIDIDVLDVGVAPQCVELSKPVDMCHHCVERRLMGVI